MIPKLIPIDLDKCTSKEDGWANSAQWHPDIKTTVQYLAKINGWYFAGGFSEQWFGYTFHGWHGTFYQLDKPGTNKSMWEGLWEIVE